MMQAAENWDRYNAADRLGASKVGRVLAQRQMGSDLVVVNRVCCEDLTQMCLAEHNYVVEAFATDRTNEPFTVTILPR